MLALLFIFEPVKTKWLYKSFKYLKKVYFKNDKRVAIYLVCVGIATGFWFLNALSKTYTVDMVVPVRYTNLPNNKTLSNQLPDQFDLKIKARGFSILRHKAIFFFGPLEFNVNDMTSNRMVEEKKSNFAFPSRKFLGELSYQLSNELEIVNMTPDTLFFRFGSLGQKRLKVKPIVNVELKKQYYISGKIETSPDSVLVNGPQPVLDTMHCVTTELQSFDKTDQTIQTKATLKKIKETFFEPQVVKLSIPVEEYTEEQLLVPVNIENQPSGRNIKLFPAKVKIAFLVSLSRFQKIHPEDFKLSVSFSDIKEGKPRLKITSESTPEYLYNLKITPEEIEYLIED